MSLGGYLRSTMVLALGFALAAALFWGLLNVPESNVPALLLSAALIVLVAVVAGFFLAVASALTQNMPAGAAARRAIAAVPMFVAGLVVFAAFWWATGTAGVWWQGHRGEVDAIILRALGATATNPLHTTVFWLLWLVRWVLGLSIITSLVVVAMLRGAGEIANGLRVSIRALPLAAAAAGVLTVTQGLWRLAYWRPENLPATQVEIVFAAAKLGVLYVATAAIGAAVLSVYGRVAKRSV